ncbi:unnamed protein product [Rotaria sp. Silwood2]|nr:unnamed protein product [Rotaria sp. Silwood2]CAF3102604.1 unnamed protein product [Rotaria sp. Silwood2]CAF4288634.1 unnamed protein product [Rotaria sp. Silwood2]CAF4387379.1 unnamed protein product [Rotaria sp. Silwood2]
MSVDNSELICRIRSMYDYNDDRKAIVDLLHRCESTNEASAFKSNSGGSSVLFHCEFPDYLRCMERYPESYCLQMIDSKDNRVVLVYVMNCKRVHFGPYIMSTVFGRLGRVDPNRQRQLVGMSAYPHVAQFVRQGGFDYGQNHTMVTNVASIQ